MILLPYTKLSHFPGNISKLKIGPLGGRTFGVDHVPLTTQKRCYMIVSIYKKRSLRISVYKFR